MRDAVLMQYALDAAWEVQGLTYPNPAVGAAVTDASGALLSVAAHRVAGGPHAEVLALQEAYAALSGDDTVGALDSAWKISNYLKQRHNGLFQDCSLFVTLEPCLHEGKTPSCAQLISELGIKRLVIGSLDPNKAAAGGAAWLQQQGVIVQTGVKKDACDALLESFAIWQRKPFVLFKWAQTLNGIINGGTLSCEESLQHMHAIRDKIDLLVIGGETVRQDRPTLDARYVQGKSPDVLIYSREKEFDRSIPLFNVPNRKVMIADSLESITDYRFVMIEGGGKMFNLCREHIDWVLCYLTPALPSSGLVFKPERITTLKPLHVLNRGCDLAIWYRHVR